ncbi:DegT/DnrJ/EryC1/StrS aminotransferase family protein [Helicobacter sp. MIT 05-5294]|uniref:DegT/DnrJ/EryC1/StrS family aminotransferase n=1 Tax=Helicobacter sp. MIT 05-5294 TaxID=1548150 RepID=UPI00051FCB83|nr:DegT/DnrJ/EryC1/StrS aminotransferase family protein [Helicobacter sp. MIT 05-5294]TLD88208.1 DegT/DnrJ/EryC1/StrS aminotransferase family protein [Helicobacter sp. MIT 05-5294]
MIKLIQPYISFDEVKKDFEEIFDSGWLTKGKYIQQFMQDLQHYINIKYAYATTSATTALSVCLKALNIQSCDEVIVSDFSFPATSNVLEDLGIKPVFADVCLSSFNMLPEELERKISNKTKAVIFVHALGNPSGISRIQEICKYYKIPLIEDAACAIGSSELGIKAGAFGDLGCFSFHPRKLLTTGEGGAVVFNNQCFEQFFEIKLNHGAVYHQGKFDFIDFGYNYRLPELQAVMGIKQLKKLDKIIQERNQIREVYIQYLKPLGFQEQEINQNVIFNVQSMVFVVPKNISRNDLITYLYENGIESTLGTYCLSGTSFSKSKYKDVQKNAKFLEDSTLTLPCYQGVDVEYISQTIKRFLTK